MYIKRNSSIEKLLHVFQLTSSVILQRKKNSFIIAFVFPFTDPPACSRSLGTAHGGFLPNSRFTASSFLEESKKPFHGRLNSSSTWCPKTRNPGIEYLMIDLLQKIKICAVAIQGDKQNKQWTKAYYIEYSQDGYKWIDVTLPNGETKVRSA